MNAPYTPLAAARAALLGAALGMAGLSLAAAPPALAQQTTTSTVPPPDVPAPTTTPLGTPATPGDTVATTNPPIGRVGPGVDTAHAVNPAPGASGPYLGVGENGFYHVQSRIDRVEQMAKARLTGAKRRRAMADIASIKAEFATQVARHGDVRDWDRENLNHRLNQLEAQVGIGRQSQGE
jgi:hypothetical protein